MNTRLALLILLLATGVARSAEWRVVLLKPPGCSSCTFVEEMLKRRAQMLAHPAKKSEILRAGIKALSALADAALVAALTAVPAIKTGRPASKDSAQQDKSNTKVRSSKR